MEMLLKEYRISLKLTKQMREHAPEEDQKIYGGMVSELEYAVKWLRDGQQPASKKVRQILISDAEFLDLLDLENDTDLYGRNPYVEVDDRIDRERRKKHAECV